MESAEPGRPTRPAAKAATAAPARRRLRWNHEGRLLAGILAVASPALLALALALGVAIEDRMLAAVAWLLVATATAVLALALQRRSVYPLYTLSNLLEALREGDYSLRGSRARRGDAVGEVVSEVNALAQTLRDQRLALEEKGALLAKIIEAMDSAVLSFDADGRLDLANPAAMRLVGGDGAGHTVATLGLTGFLGADAPRVVEHAFAGGSGRWNCGTRVSARTAGRTTCSSSAISAAPCARRSAWPGSACCACSGTNSPTRSRRSARPPTRSPAWPTAPMRRPPTRATTCATACA